MPATNQLANTDTLSQLIGQKFALFTGQRPAEQDQALYDLVFEHCFNETIRFLAENLSSSRKIALTQQLESFGPASTNDEAKAAFDTLLTHLDTVPSGRFRLDVRIKHCLDTLAYRAVQRRKAKHD